MSRKIIALGMSILIKASEGMPNLCFRPCDVMGYDDLVRTTRGLKLQNIGTYQ